MEKIITFDLQRFATVVVTSQSELQTALNSATADTTIQLGADIDVTSQISVSNTSASKITLDLNGKTITATGNNWDNTNRKCDVFKITQGEFTVKNGSIDVNIDKGVLTGGYFDSLNNNADASVNDYLNVFYVKGDASNKPSLTLGEGLVMNYDSNTKVEVTGVLIEGEASGTSDTASSTTTTNAASVTIDGAKISVYNGTVMASRGRTYIDIKGNSELYYTSPTDNFTLQLGRWARTNTYGAHVVVEDNALISSVAKAGYSQALMLYGGYAEFKGGTMVSTGSDVFSVQGNAYAKITGGTYQANGAWEIGRLAVDSTVDIEGGTFSTGYARAFLLTDGSTNGNKLNISGGTINAADTSLYGGGKGMVAWSYSGANNEINITGGNITGGYSAGDFYMSAGKITVSETSNITSNNGSTIRLVGSNTQATISGGTISSPTAGVYAQSGTTANISGGTFNGTGDAIKVASNATVSVTKGTFNTTKDIELLSGAKITLGDATYTAVGGSIVLEVTSSGDTISNVAVSSLGAENAYISATITASQTATINGVTFKAGSEESNTITTGLSTENSFRITAGEVTATGLTAGYTINDIKYTAENSTGSVKISSSNNPELTGDFTVTADSLIDKIFDVINGTVDFGDKKVTTTSTTAVPVKLVNGGISVNNDIAAVNTTGYTATVTSDGVTEISDLANGGANVTGNKLTSVSTVKEAQINGTYNIGGTQLVIAESGSAEDGVTFAMSSGTLTGISGLIGSVSGNVGSLTVNEKALGITGDTEITVVGNSDGIEAVTGVSNGATISSASAQIVNKIVTDGSGKFTIGEKAFTVSGDTNGVTFTLDSSGNVTAINGLDANATITVPDGTTSILINNQPFATDSTDSKLKLDGETVVLGLIDDEDQYAQVLSSKAFTLKYDSGNVTVTVDENTYASGTDEYNSFISNVDGTTITLAKDVAPTSSSAITIDGDVTVQSLGGKTYVTTGNSVGSNFVQVYSSGDLRVVNASGTAVSLSTETVVIPTGMSLLPTGAEGFTISAGKDDSDVTAKFTSATAIALDKKATVTGATANTTFTLGAADNFVINGTTIASAAGTPAQYVADGSFTVGSTSIAVTGVTNYTITASASAITEVSGLPTNGATITATGSFDVKTAEAGVSGSYVIGSKTFEVRENSGTDGVTFTFTSNELTAVSNLDGTISGDLTAITKINDKDFTIKNDTAVTATADSTNGITAISGLTGGATLTSSTVETVTTDGAGAFTIGNVTYTIADDSDGVTFTVDNGAVTQISGLAADGIVKVSVASGGTAPTSLTVNGVDYGTNGITVTDFETATIKGTNDGTSSKLDLTSSNYDYYVNVSGDVMTVTAKSDSTTIATWSGVKSVDGLGELVGNTFRLTQAIGTTAGNVKTLSVYNESGTVAIYDASDFARSGEVHLGSVTKAGLKVSSSTGTAVAGITPTGKMITMLSASDTEVSSLASATGSVYIPQLVQLTVGNNTFTKTKPTQYGGTEGTWMTFAENAVTLGRDIVLGGTVDSNISFTFANDNNLVTFVSPNTSLSIAGITVNTSAHTAGNDKILYRDSGLQINGSANRISIFDKDGKEKSNYTVTVDANGYISAVSGLEADDQIRSIYTGNSTGVNITTAAPTSATKINIGGAVYTVTSGSTPIYTVKNSAVSAITNINGSVTGDFRGGRTVNDTNIQVTGDDEITVSATSTSAATTITGVNSGAVIKKFNGTVTTSEAGTFGFSDTAINYLTVSGDDDGVTFAYSDSMWNVSGLKTGAILNANVANKFKVGNETLDANGYYMATAENAVKALADMGAYIVLDTSGAATSIYALNDGKLMGNNLINAEGSDTYVKSVSSGTITLGESTTEGTPTATKPITPTESKPIVIISQAATTSVKSSDGSTTYVSSATNLGSTVGIKIVGADDLRFATAPTNEAAAVELTNVSSINANASVNLLKGQKLQVTAAVSDTTGSTGKAAFNIVADNAVTANFISSTAVSLNAASTAEGVPTGTKLTLSAAGNYNINGFALNSVAASTAVEVLANTTYGEFLSVNLSNAGTFTYNGITYTAGAANSKVYFNSSVVRLDGTFTVTGEVDETTEFILAQGTSNKYNIGGIEINVASATTDTRVSMLTSDTLSSEKAIDAISVGGKAVRISNDEAYTINVGTNGTADSIVDLNGGAVIESAGGASTLTGAAGTYTIGGIQLITTAQGSSNTNFIVTSDTVVTSITGVSEVQGDFRNGLKVSSTTTEATDTLTVTGDSDVTFTVSSKTISGLDSGAVVDSTNYGGATTAVTSGSGIFTLKDKVYNVSSDTNAGVTYTFATGAITGLDENATLTVSSGTDVKVNGITYATTRTVNASTVIVPDVTKIVIKGTSSGTSSTLDLDALDISSYYIDVTNGTISALDSAKKVIATQSTWSDVATIESSVVKLFDAAKPVYISGATGIEGYVSNVSGLASGVGFVLDDGKLSLATITTSNSTTTATKLTTAPTAGNLTLAEAGTTLYVTEGYTITGSTTATFGSNTLTLSDVATVSGAPASTTFTLTAEGTYKINGREITGKGLAVVLGTDGIEETITLTESSAFTDTTANISYTGAGTYSIAGDNKVSLTSADNATITATGAQTNANFTVKGTVDFASGTFVQEIVSTDANVAITLTENGLKVADNVNKVVDVRDDADGYVVNIGSDNNIKTITGIDAGASIWSFGAVDSNIVSATSKTEASTSGNYTFVNGTFNVADTDGDKNGITFMAGNDNKVIKLDGLDQGSKVIVGAGDNDANLTYSALQVNGTSFSNVLAGTVITGTDKGNYAKIQADGYLIDVASTSAISYSIIQNDKIVADAGSSSVVQDTTFKLANGVLDSSTTITTIVEDSKTYGLTNSATTLFSNLTKLSQKVDGSDTFYGIKTTVDKDGVTALTLVSKDNPFSSLSEMPAFTGGLTIYSDASLAIALSDTKSYNIASLNQTAIEFNTEAGTNNSTTYLATLNGAANVTNTLMATTFTLETDTELYNINGSFFKVTETATVNATADPQTATLYAGTVVLDFGADNSFVQATASGTATVESGTVFATAADGKLTQIGNIDVVGEKFTINYSDTTNAYQMTAYGLAVDSSSGTFSGIYEAITTNTAVFNLNDAYTATAVLDANNGAITIDSNTGNAFFVQTPSDLGTFYTKLTVDGKNFTFDALDGAASMTSVDATAITDSSSYTLKFNADVNVGTVDSATTTAFTINNTIFDAYNVLKVAANYSDDAQSATLTDGLVNVNANELTTTKTETEGSGQVVGVTGDDNGVKTTVADGVVKSITDLDAGGTVTVTDAEGKTTTYNRVDNKLKVTTSDGTSKEYSDEISTATDIINFTGSVGVYVQIENGYILNLNNGISALTREGDTVEQVDYGTLTLEQHASDTTHFAELTQSTTSVYTFKQNLGSNSETLTQKAVIDGTGVEGGFALNLDFDADVKTSGTNVFTINGVEFSAASELTLTAADNSAALFEGTVNLNSSYTSVAATTSGTATFSAGDGILATAADGKLSEISGINTGDIFAAAFDSSTATYYKMTKAGLLKGDGESSFNGIWLDAESSLTADNATSFIGMIAGSTTITLPATGISTGTSVVVDNTNDPTKFYATLNYESGTAQTFTFEQTAGKVDDKFDAVNATAYTSPISVDVKLDKISVFVGADSEESVKYTVNSDEFNALTQLELKTFFNTTPAVQNGGGELLAENEKDSGATLENGSVQVLQGTDVTTTNSETVSVTGDSDGVKATASEGKLTSVTGLDVGGTLTLTDSGTATTYTMTDGIVTLGDALYKADSATNLLALDSSTALAYVPLTNGDAYGVDLASGVEKFSVAPTIIYGTENTYNKTFFATMTGESGTGVYNLTADGTESSTVITKGVTVDASGVDGFKTLTLDFAAQVTTPSATGVFTINDVAFNAVSGTLVIDAYKDSASTLFEGTVGLNDTYKDVTATASETVTATTSNELDVVVKEGKVVSFGALDYSGESFALTSSGTTTTYTMNGDIKQVTRNVDGTYSLWNGADISDTVTVETLKLDNWNKMFAGAANALTLQATETNLTFVDDVTAPKALYANQTYADNVYTVASESSLGDAVTIDASALTNGDALSTTFAATVTIKDSGTFTINTAVFATADSVTLDATTATATFNSGSVFALKDLDVTVTGGRKVNVVDDEDGVVVQGDAAKLTSITDLDANAIVTITEEDGATSTYKMAESGILAVTDASDTKYYVDQGTATNILDLSKASQIAYVQITDSTLNLSSGTSKLAGDITSVLYGTAETFDGNTFFATMAESGTGIYSFTKSGSDTVTNPAITTSGVDGFKGVVTDFEALVTTPETAGTYSVDGVSYAAKEGALKVYATTSNSESTLYNGTVVLDSTGIKVVDPTSDPVVTATNGDIDVAVEDGKLTTVGDVENSETFTIGSDTYAKTTGGLFKTDSDGNESVLQGSSDSDTVSFSLSDDKWDTIYTVNDDNEFIVYLDSDTTQTFYNKDKTAVVAEYDGANKVLTAGSAASEVKGVKVVGDNDDTGLSLADAAFANASITLDNVKSVTDAAAGQIFKLPNADSDTGGLVSINDKNVDNTISNGTDAIVTNISTGLKFGENGTGGLISLTDTDDSDTAITGYTIALDEKGGLENSTLTLEGKPKGTLTTADDFENGKVAFAVGSRTEEFDISSDTDDNGVTFKLNNSRVYEIIDLAPNTAKLTVNVTLDGNPYTDDSQADVTAPSSGKISYDSDATAGSRWFANTYTEDPTEVNTDTADNYIVYLDNTGNIKLLVKDSDTATFNETTKVQDYERVLDSTFAPLTDGARLKNISATGSTLKLSSTYEDYGVTFINDYSADVKVVDSSNNSVLSKVVYDGANGTEEKAFRLNTAGATAVEVTATTDGDGVTTATSATAALTPATATGNIEGVEVSIAKGKTLTLNEDSYTVTAASDTVAITINNPASDLAVAKAATIVVPEGVNLELATDSYTVNNIAIATSNATVTTASNELDVKGTFSYTDVTVTTATDSDAAIINTTNGELTLANGNVATTGVNGKTLNLAASAEVTVNTVGLTTTDTTTVTTEDGKLNVAASIGCESMTLLGGTMTVTTDTKVFTLNNEANLVGVDELSKDIYVASEAVVQINGIANLQTSSTDTKITAVDDDKIVFAPSDATVTQSSLTFSGGSATIENSGEVTLADGAILTDTTDAYTFTVQTGAKVVIDGKTFIATGSSDVVVTNAANGFKVGEEEFTVDGDSKFTVTAAQDDIISVSGISSNAVVTTSSTNTSINAITENEGEFTMGDKSFTISGDDSVIFGIENNRAKTIDDLGGVVVGDFTTAATINGGRVYVAGDDQISVTAATDVGVTNIDGVGADDGVTVVSAGGATLVSSDKEGTFQFNTLTGASASNSQVFTAEGDSVVSFLTSTISGDTLQSPSVTGVNGLDNGSIAINQDASKGFTVNGNSVTLSSVETPVTLVAENSVVSTVNGLTGLINGLTDNVTVNAVDSDVTINGSTIQIDEGDGAATVAGLIADGKLSSVTGLNQNATVTTAQNLEVVTEEQGVFTFPNGTFTIDGDNSVIFVTDGKSQVKDIKDFAGTLNSTENNVTVNGAAVYTSNTDASITSAGTGVSAVLGLNSGDSVSIPDSAIVEMPAATDSDTTTLTVNGKTYKLEGDSDGVSIDGGAIPEITGLAPGAKLVTANTAGTYVVNGTPLTVGVGSTIVGDAEGTAHIYDPNDVDIDGDSDNVDDIVQKITGSTSDADSDTRYVENLDSETAQALAAEIASGNTANANGNIQMQLNNDAGDETQVADFSNTTGIKKVSLEGGAQDVKFNDAGGNIAVISDDASGAKNVSLGAGGDLAAIGKTDADVNVTAGRGADTVVGQGRNMKVDLSAGGPTKLMATGYGAAMEVTGYDHNTGAGIQTTNNNIKQAVKTNTIQLENGLVTANGATTRTNADTADGVSVVNLYNLKGLMTKVGYTHNEGGTLDMSGEHSDVVLKGNYTEGGAQRKSGTSKLMGGLGNDYALGGAGDDIDLGAGDNTLELDPSTRSTSDAGATVNQTATTGRTVVNGFNNEFGTTGDKLNISGAASVSFIGGVLRFVLGAAELLINGVSGLSADAADSADLAESADEDDTATTVSGSTNYAPININDVNTAIIAENQWIGGGDSLWSSDYMPTAYVGTGSGSGIDLRSMEGNVDMVLSGANGANSTGVFGSTNVDLRGINKVRLGSGNSTVRGTADVNNTIVAGVGASSVWGGGASDDTFIGRQTSLKSGADTFFYVNGDGADVISNFEFRTSENGATADKINVLDAVVTGASVSGQDVLVNLTGDQDRLTIKNAVGQDFQIEYGNVGSFETLTAQVNYDSLNFDGRAGYYQAVNKNAAVVASSELENAEIWLNNNRDFSDKTFVGDFKVLNASNVAGRSTLVGNSNDNTIFGSSENSSMWGGDKGGNDTLVGGAGADMFWYGKNNGSDTVTQVDENDVVNLYDVNIADVESYEDWVITNNAVSFNLKDSVGGGSLTIISNNAGFGIKFADDSNTYAINQRDRSYHAK